MDREKVVAEYLNLITTANLNGAATPNEWSSTVHDYFMQCSDCDSSEDTSECSCDDEIDDKLKVSESPAVVIDVVKAWEANSDFVIQDCPDVEKAKVDKFRFVC